MRKVWRMHRRRYEKRYGKGVAYKEDMARKLHRGRYGKGIA